MHSAIVQEQAKALLRAALLGVLAAHASEESYPTAVTASFDYDDVDADGEFTITVLHGKQFVPVAGGSL